MKYKYFFNKFMINIKKNLLKLSGKKFLINGGEGMLGIAFDEMLKKYVPNCQIIKCTKKELDVTNLEQVLSYDNKKLDFIIHCASISSLTPVEYCEEHPDESYKVYVQGINNIIELAKKTNSKLFYPQSFLIYDGKSNPVNEETKPNPLSLYAKHKLESELIIFNKFQNSLVVRMGGFFGGRENDKNFVGKIIPEILKKIHSEEKLLEIGDRIWQPTFTNDLALNCLLLLANQKSGKYNMASHGKASFYELTKEIVSILSLTKKINLVKISSSKFSKKEKAKRPLLVLMNNRKLEKEGLDIQRNWQEELKEYLSHQYFKKLF
jgi:dTDP-4-dehydrorhamnose reductase